LPWAISKHKIFTLGIEGSDQIYFQILETGGPGHKIVGENNLL
jgi:hypothetical protein